MQSNSVNYVGFNQDYQSILMGNSNGYSIYCVENDKVILKECNNISPIMKVGRLYSSSLVVFVSSDDPRKLTLFHHKRNAVIIEVKFSNSILSVKLNRKVVVVCTEDGIYIYDTENMKRKHKVEIAPSNRHGIFALSIGDFSVLAYPSTNMNGNVHVFSIAEMKNVVIIEAHQGAIAALEFNQTSDCLATASDKGTVIRLFKIPSGDKLGEFRRGFARCATISCISFSLDSNFLLVCSNTETIHVFNMSQGGEKDICSKHSGSNLTYGIKDDVNYSLLNSDNNIYSSNWFNYVGSALKATRSYLPYPAQQMSEIFSQDRCFSVARLPSIESLSNQSKYSQRKVGAVIKYDEGWRIVVATFDGFIYIFKFDNENGREAELIIIYDLINDKYIKTNQSLIPENNKSMEISSEQSTKYDSMSSKSYSVGESNIYQPNSLDLADEHEFPPIKRLT